MRLAPCNENAPQESRHRFCPWGAVAGVAGSFASTAIATGGDFSAALKAAAVGAIVGGISAGLASGLTSGATAAAAQAGAQTTTAASTSITVDSVVSNLIQGVTKTVVGDAAGLLANKLVYGKAGSALGKNLLLSAGLAVATSLAATAIGHLPAAEELWQSGPTIGDTGVTFTQELIKAPLQGLASYGIGEALGVKDPEAMGIGAATASFAAPWVEMGTAALSNGTGLKFDLANSQIEGLLGGSVSALAGHDYGLASYAAQQFYNNNDILGRKGRRQLEDLQAAIERQALEAQNISTLGWDDAAISAQYAELFGTEPSSELLTSEPLELAPSQDASGMDLFSKEPAKLAIESGSPSPLATKGFSLEPSESVLEDYWPGDPKTLVEVSDPAALMEILEGVHNGLISLDPDIELQALMTQDFLDRQAALRTGQDMSRALPDYEPLKRPVPITFMVGDTAQAFLMSLEHPLSYQDMGNGFVRVLGGSTPSSLADLRSALRSSALQEALVADGLRGLYHGEPLRSEIEQYSIEATAIADYGVNHNSLFLAGVGSVGETVFEGLAAAVTPQSYVERYQQQLNLLEGDHLLALGLGVAQPPAETIWSIFK